MFKNLTATTKLFIALILLVVIIMVIMISVSGNKVPTSSPMHYLTDTASADNKVEALKTMTAELVSVSDKNAVLQKKVDDIEANNTKLVTDLKTSVNNQVAEALKTIQTKEAQDEAALQVSSKSLKTDEYPIHSDSSNTDTSNSFVWVSDVTGSGNSVDTSKGESDNSTTNNLLGSSLNNSTKIVAPVTPVYTIPVNATLTGATLMTPLIGRIPIDGKLPSPYSFKLVLSAHNLTANGYPMPGVTGAVLSGIASGDLLGSCARGDLHSITFIFKDGTISTTEAKGDNDSLGYLSSETGNPCIAGTFHRDAAIFLGAQMGLAGLQGYASAFSQSQYSGSITPEGSSISTLVGSANNAALGQGGSAAAQAAQTWWNQRVQNSFDYVYVPNKDDATGKLMKVVVNISQQILINYDPNARKVNYETSSLLSHDLD